MPKEGFSVAKSVLTKGVQCTSLMPKEGVSHRKRCLDKGVTVYLDGLFKERMFEKVEA